MKRLIRCMGNGERETHGHIQNLAQRGRLMGVLVPAALSATLSAALLAGCAMPIQTPAQTQTPPGTTETQRFQWAGGTAVVGRMPDGSSRIAFSPTLGVDLGQAGTVVIEQADPALGGAMFVVRAATPGCDQGHRVFRVVHGRASGWVLGGCNASVAVVRADAAGWAAVQKDGPVVRSYRVGGSGTLDVHVAPNVTNVTNVTEVTFQRPPPAKQTVAHALMTPAVPKAGPSPASHNAAPAASKSDEASGGGAAARMLPSKLAAGSRASGADATPVVVDLETRH